LGFIWNLGFVICDFDFTTIQQGFDPGGQIQQLWKGYSYDKEVKLA
jgi:hypothetical protein